MVSLAAGLPGAVIQVLKWVGGPIKRQFKYLCCFTSNIKNLEKESKKLDDAEGGLQVQVDRALEDVRDIDPQVVTWLKDSKEIKEKKTAILDQVPNVDVCLKVVPRYSHSKRATKTADRMKELRDECSKFDVISHPGPPAARETVQLGKTYEFESRKQIEEEIMTVLRGGDVSMIGISGMGGLGKTIMAKRIMNRVLKEHVFEEAVIAAVSQPIDKLKIQKEIGGSLSLNLEAETSEAGRKRKLQARLNGTKRILLVLDDVWEPIELEEFGIPCDSKSCTILITSRNTDTLSKMDVKEFGMKILSKVEARFLFREKAGTCMDDDELKSIAEEIVEECEGLPLALAAVGDAQKGEKDPSSWRDALRQLRQCDPDIPSHIEKIYSKLRLSYDLLRSKHAKFLFLLCSLYREDANIAIEELTCFGMGMGIFEGIGNLERVRDRVFVSITLLKNRSLLIHSERRNHVRMHDAVRDVCIYIAKQEGYVGGNSCSWISSFDLFGERSNIPIRLGFPNLRLLFCGGGHKYNSEGEEFEFDNTFFERISDLYVLCIQHYWSLQSLPLTHSLKNLKSLVLDSCDGVETISIVGEFVHLEILICRNSPLIEELPLEIKRLNRLKLLELTRCENLQRIGQGIISSLLGLEELKMLRSFNRWESEDRAERENAGLRELEALANLTWLEIEIRDPALASEKMHLSSKISRFCINIGTGAALASDDHSYMKILALESMREEPCLGNSLEMQLLRDTQYLHLSGNGANNVDLTKCQNIKWLKLIKCQTMKNMTTTSMVIASLQHLILDSLPKLEGICDGPISSNSFQNLKELKLFHLEALKQLWKSSGPPLFTNLSSITIDRCRHLCNLGQLSIVGKYCFPQLEVLVIKRCEMMEQVFLWNKEDESKNNHCITKVFPKLKEVELSYLPNLAIFYQGTGGFEFPLLTKLSIRECPKWKSIASNHNTGGSNADIDDDSSHLFCQSKKVSFGNLKEFVLSSQWNPFCGHEISSSLLNGLEDLTLHWLYGRRSLFSSAVAGNLVNLRRLKISYWNEMLKVIEDKKEDEKAKVVSFGNDSESQSHHCITKVFSKLKKVIKYDEKLKVIEDKKEDEEEEKGEMTLLFPKLEYLELEDLPKLVSFCEWKCDIKLPSLRKVLIKRCLDMVNLSLGLLATPNLEHFETDLTSNLETEVSFDSLKKLEIQWSEKPLYGHKFFISLLNGLKELQVFRCSMSCLFTSSMASCLDSLEVLIIRQCNEMVRVIEDEENGEENVGSGVGERTLLFPNLKKLKLEWLPKLESFCEWKCDIELPSLRKVVLWDCPILRNFTMGSSIAAAPNLEKIKIENGEIVGGIKELNSVVQQYMEKRREEMEEMVKRIRKQRVKLRSPKIDTSQ